MKTPRFAAVVLAAGLSSRMKGFKPLLPLGKATITDHIISTFKSVNVDVILVVGYRRDDVINTIKDKDITVIFNPDYEKEMFSSIQVGIRELGQRYKGFFILPVDIPLVKPSTIQSLMKAAQENPGKIINPTHHEKMGHPPLIPTSLIPVILGWGKGGGLKAVLQAYEKRVISVPVDDKYILVDIDTPDDYRKLLKHMLDQK
jgi:CTP:molybdopterin cytidylyltransferase MocA